MPCWTTIHCWQADLDGGLMREGAFPNNGFLFNDFLQGCTLHCQMSFLNIFLLVHPFSWLPVSWLFFGQHDLAPRSCNDPMLQTIEARIVFQVSKQCWLCPFLCLKLTGSTFCSVAKKSGKNSKMWHFGKKSVTARRQSQCKKPRRRRPRSYQLSDSDSAKKRRMFLRN